jgi:metal-responsive CopG/Arc/MetJ family transcriptional regulator
MAGDNSEEIEEMVLVGCRVPQRLVEKLDAQAKKRHFANRTELVRHLLREEVEKAEHVAQSQPVEVA